MVSWPCPRCKRPFPNPVACGEHAFGCKDNPDPEPKRADPGKKLEERVAASAKALRPQGLALDWIRPGKSRSGHYYRTGRCDFEGDWNGRGVKFDAKSCGEPALPISKIQRQIDRVRAAHERGAIAFFLVEMRGEAEGRREPRYFALPWPVVAAYVGAGAQRSSIPLAVLVARCPEIARHGRLLDLVAGIRAVAALADGGAA